jgi:hypothetical protein
MKIHDFYERLNYGQKALDDAFWETFYRRAFPSMARMITTGSDPNSQERGVDRIIQLHNKHTIYVDEKVREQYYPDFCLEYVSNDVTDAPGWIEKPLHIDYIAYVWEDQRTGFLLDFPMLQRAWFHYRDAWKRDYPLKKAPNKGYHTLFVAVPIRVVFRAIAAACQIQVAEEQRK